MADVTIRDLDDDLTARLRVTAAARGISMEELIRRILTHQFADESSDVGLGTRIVQLFAGLGPVEIPERRGPVREFDPGP